MKISKYILPVFLFSLGYSVTMQAQDTIFDRNVNVEREYKPIIQDAGKINSVPEVLEPTVIKSVPKYNEFNLPLSVDYNIHTLSAAEMKHDQGDIAKGGFARFGLGSNFNSLLDFAYPIVNKPDMRLDFSLNHFATFSSKAHSTTKAALSFDKYFKNLDWYTGVGGGHEYFKYYGDNFNINRPDTLDLNGLANSYPMASYEERNLTSISRNAQTYSLRELADAALAETFWRFNAFTGVRSLPLSTGLRYKAEVKYQLFDSRNGLTEHLIHSQAGFSTPLDSNRIGVDLDLYNLMYRSNNAESLNFWDAYSVFSMNPYYSIERAHFNVRLGVKSAFSFVHGKPFNPSADVNAEWKMIPKYLSLYGGLTGGYDVNTLDNMFTENRYLYSDVRVQDTYTPYNVYAGIKVKPLYNLLLDGYVDYRYIDNQYFFVNKEYELTSPLNGMSYVNSNLYTNRFNVLYSSASLLKIGVRANYNLQDRLNVQLKGAFNGWDVATEEFAWNKPRWEADLSTDVHITRDLSVSTNVFFEGERYAKIGESPMRMRPKVDINLGLSYSYLQWFTAFVKVNNLIDNPYQNFYGYEVQGQNVLVGAAFSF